MINTLLCGQGASERPQVILYFLVLEVKLEYFSFKKSSDQFMDHLKYS
jgi:hypothetical protein